MNLATAVVFQVCRFCSFSTKIWPDLEVKIPKPCKKISPHNLFRPPSGLDPFHLESLGRAKLHLFAASNMFERPGSFQHAETVPFLILSRWSTRKGLLLKWRSHKQFAKKEVDRSTASWCWLHVLEEKVPFWQVKSWISRKFSGRFFRDFQTPTPTTSSWQKATKHPSDIFVLVVWIVWFKPWRSNLAYWAIVPSIPGEQTSCLFSRYYRSNIYISKELRWLLPGKLEHKVCPGGGVKEFNHFCFGRTTYISNLGHQLF